MLVECADDDCVYKTKFYHLHGAREVADIERIELKAIIRSYYRGLEEPADADHVAIVIELAEGFTMIRIVLFD